MIFIIQIVSFICLYKTSQPKQNTTSHTECRLHSGCPIILVSTKLVFSKLSESGTVSRRRRNTESRRRETQTIYKEINQIIIFLF